MNKERKIGRVLQTIAMVILFALIIVMMNWVKDIQGTARVVNYAGLVRGATQRMVKLEIVGISDDDNIKELDNYLDGIGNGSESLNLIRIKDSTYQSRIKDLNTAWNKLKEEILKVRQVGYENTDIVEISEGYFYIADDVVSIAENYSERCAKRIGEIESVIILLIIVLTIQLLQYAFKSAKMSKANRKLKAEVYIDKQTGLPNKAKCIELIEQKGFVTEPTSVFMFDLNNLKYVNDNFGHESGDKLIESFARLICESISKEYFVGRYGGDEFIAVITGEAAKNPKKIIQLVQDRVTLYNGAAPDIPISYAVGYATNVEKTECTMRMLLAEADKYMYINKNKTKESAYAVEKQMQDSLSQVIKDLKFVAQHDDMTGLLNKTTASTLIEEMAAKAPKGYHAMVVCDIDDFKHINDSYGHIVGDEAIKAVALCLRQNYENRAEVITRFGGDEFAVYIDSVDSMQTLKAEAELLLQKMHSQTSSIADGKITLSIGIFAIQQASNWKEMFQNADAALYDAKKLGKNQFEIKVKNKK